MDSSELDKLDLNISTLKKKIISPNFYNTPATNLAKKLIGCALIHNVDNKILGGMIVETEAYLGPVDKASHAYKKTLLPKNFSIEKSTKRFYPFLKDGKKTHRTKTMFLCGGCAYIYFVYGVHFMFNVTAGPEGYPQAVLVRALVPLIGIQEMKKENTSSNIEKFCSGPGKLCKTLKISKAQNNTKLWEEPLFICNFKKFSQEEIISAPRIGIDYAKEHSLLNWRFFLKNCPSVSKGIR